VRKHVHAPPRRNTGYFLRTLWTLLLSPRYGEPSLFVGTPRLLRGNTYLWHVWVVIYERSTTDQVHCIRQVIEASAPRWMFEGGMLWQNHLRNEGSVFQDPDRVILDKARMQQTHIRSIENNNFIENWSYYTLVWRLQGWEAEGASKIEHLCGSVSLDNQGHSPHPRGEGLHWQLYTYDGLQYGIQFSETLSSH
jgi:hypothetical protein